jgi:hypothetical protein
MLSLLVSSSYIYSMQNITPSWTQQEHKAYALAQSLEYLQGNDMRLNILSRHAGLTPHTADHIGHALKTHLIYNDTRPYTYMSDKEYINNLSHTFFHTLIHHEKVIYTEPDDMYDCIYTHIYTKHIYPFLALMTYYKNLMYHVCMHRNLAHTHTYNQREKELSRNVLHAKDKLHKGLKHIISLYRSDGHSHKDKTCILSSIHNLSKNIIHALDAGTKSLSEKVYSIQNYTWAHIIYLYVTISLTRSIIERAYHAIPDTDSEYDDSYLRAYILMCLPYVTHSCKYIHHIIRTYYTHSLRTQQLYKEIQDDMRTISYLCSDSDT